MANASPSTKKTRRRTRDMSPRIHPGVEVHSAPQVYSDASGAPAVLAHRGFVFALDMLGEVKLRLIGGDGMTGTRVRSKIARDLCLHAYLTLLDARVDDDWRERNVRLYDDADDKEPSALAAACAELGMTLSAEERAGLHAYADAALPQGSTLARLRAEEES